MEKITCWSLMGTSFFAKPGISLAASREAFKLVEGVNLPRFYLKYPN
jgi:hypothetical protein